MSFNNLTVIELNENLTDLYALDNKLEKIILNKKLEELYISNRENKNIQFDNSVNNTKVQIDYVVIPSQIIKSDGYGTLSF